MREISIPDGIMTGLLVFAVPIYAAWRKTRPEAPKIALYQRGLMLAYALLLPFGVIWWWEGRSPAEFGLNWPLRMVDLVLIALALAALILLTIVGRIAGRKASPQRPTPHLLPGTSVEIGWYLAMIISLGIIWEVLYRGYLQRSLGAVLGLWPAVLISALAYGLAHGIKSRQQMIGSLISALIFSTAYALSHSLWWLIIIHSGLPFVGLVLSRRKMDATEDL